MAIHVVTSNEVYSFESESVRYVGTITPGSPVRKLLVMTAIALVALFIVAPRFVRWTSTRPKAVFGRQAILQRTFVDSTTVADSDGVVAVVMESNLGGGIISTLVVFADGKTTLYTTRAKLLTSDSPKVREAAELFRSAVADHTDHFQTTADFDPPANGKTRFYILTRTGTFGSWADQTVILQSPNQPLHPLLEAGQATVSEIQRTN